MVPDVGLTGPTHKNPVHVCLKFRVSSYSCHLWCFSCIWLLPVCVAFLYQTSNRVNAQESVLVSHSTNRYCKKRCNSWIIDPISKARSKSWTWAVACWHHNMSPQPCRISSQVCMLLHWIFAVGGQPVCLHCLKPQLVSNMFFARIVTACFPSALELLLHFISIPEPHFETFWLLVLFGLFHQLVRSGAFCRNVGVQMIASTIAQQSATQSAVHLGYFRLLQSHRWAPAKPSENPQCSVPLRPSLAKHRCFFTLWRTMVFWGRRCWTTAWQGLWFCKKLRKLFKWFQMDANMFQTRWQCNDMQWDCDSQAFSFRVYGSTTTAALWLSNPSLRCHPGRSGMK